MTSTAMIQEFCKIKNKNISTYLNWPTTKPLSADGTEEGAPGVVSDVTPTGVTTHVLPFGKQDTLH